MKKYDVVIIGAGTAGLSARKQVAKKTDSYLVIDKGVLGTTCARVGCMPSKVLIHAANMYYYSKQQFDSLGIVGSQKLDVDLTKVMKHVRALRDRFVSSVLKDMDKWQSKHFLAGTAKFEDKNTLNVDGQQIQAKKIVIATGSSPVIPKAWKPFEAFFLDTNYFFEQKKFPKSMAVIGLGAIGIELGQALSRLGIDVVAIAKKRSISNLSDPDLINAAVESLAKEMTFDFSSVSSMNEIDGKLQIKTKNKTYSVEKALIAVGRNPNIKGLGLENVCQTFSAEGIPAYDSHALQLIDAPNIYIAGDVNQERAILHEAADEGTVSGYNAVAENHQLFARRTPMYITFSAPNIAVVGQSYKQLREKKVSFVSGQVSYKGQGRAIVLLQEVGLLKVYADKNSGVLLGAELFAPEGEYLAHLLAWVIQQNMTVQDILELPFYHPSITEGLRTALRDAKHRLNTVSQPLEFKKLEAVH